MSSSGGDKHDGPLASLHRLDSDRPKRRRSLSKQPAVPSEETPTPDRNAALSMLGTFDLDLDADSRSPDEILAALATEPTVSGSDDPAPASPTDAPVATRDIPAAEDVHSDEILRELEEHHHRGQTTARPSAPRGSAELRPVLRRRVPPTRKREVRGRPSGESNPLDGRKRLALALVAAAVFTATASAVTLSQLGGAATRPAAPTGSNRIAATTGLTHAPTKLSDTVANAIASEGRQLTRPVKSPVTHRRRLAAVRKHSPRHHLVTPASASPAASTSPVTRGPSYSSSTSPAASSSQAAPSAGAAATRSNTPHGSQPAFGQNGSLGPGRGAAGTQ